MRVPVPLLLVLALVGLAAVCAAPRAVPRSARVHFTALPRTGRWAGPLPSAPGGRPDARLSIPRLGITHAPVWSRGSAAVPGSPQGFAAVPQWGVTRFAPSAPFGRPGLTLAYGHDDQDGGIFHWLSALQGPDPQQQPPFPGDEIQVWAHRRLYRYHVRRMVITEPTDVRLLNRPWRRPTLILVSCTPYRVDTLRVLVVAQLAS